MIIKVMEKRIDLNRVGQSIDSWDVPFPVFVPHGHTVNQMAAGTLTRFSGNPVLKPIKEHQWESKYVLNAATIGLDGKVYMVYRAYGDDEISRLGLAVSKDGFNFTERLETPIFEPDHSSESLGCEDPRLTLLGARVFMTYTAWDGEVPQIGLASIWVKDFLNYRWKEWQRHGLFLPGVPNKDATLFPEEFNGKVAMLHRIEPHIWITYSSRRPEQPWPNTGHQIIAKATGGMDWDSKKIGAGAQPIKTKYGWLMITHGVDHAKVYRLGVMLLDLKNPSKLIYRSPNAILEPVNECELGGDDQSWVPNVVFTCGAVPRELHKPILDANDELIVYYGAADTVMSIATAKIGDLIPEEIRG
ncbi:MAG: glycosidase [Chloroflexi bacterium]|jgi:predicted GH43/DUF377 family glycosyl hydrolase|nr:glycosidase [Chloroflexota bacterium]